MADHDLTEQDERAAMQRQQLEVIKQRIDGELRISRPDRYEPGDTFLDAVAERIASEVPATLARELLARDLVGQREGQATKRVNKFLKGLTGANGQYALPVDWYLYVDEPVAILTPSPTDADPGATRRERVALRAVTPIDWLNFATTGRVEAQHRHDAEMRMYDAAEWLASEQSNSQFSEWAQTIAPLSVEPTA